MKRRPKKHDDILGLARRCIEGGRYRDTTHAGERRIERVVTLPDMKYVILNGWWEKAKDEYREEYQAWNCAIRGKTVDARSLRIVISFDEESRMLIITAVDLNV